MRNRGKKLKYKKAILKISGEFLGTKGKLFDRNSITYITEQIVKVHQAGVRLGIVVGAGNIIRGRETDWMPRIDADISGMMATIINGIVLYSQLQLKKVPVRLCSSMEVKGVVNRFNKFEDKEFFDAGTVLLFVGGTGNPLFTTDSAAAVRAVELGADILIKGTKVEGVYSSDPQKNPRAVFYPSLTFDQAIRENLQVMDLTAFNICRENKIRICVYNFMKYSLKDIFVGMYIGSLLKPGGKHD